MELTHTKKFSTRYSKALLPLLSMEGKTSIFFWNQVQNKYFNLSVSKFFCYNVSVVASFGLI